jgi:hypothetical protein
VIRIADEFGTVIPENRLGFLKADAVLPDVGRSFFVIPFKVK